jgi:hypothetical protein
MINEINSKYIKQTVNYENLKLISKGLVEALHKVPCKCDLLNDIQCQRCKAVDAYVKFKELK